MDRRQRSRRVRADHFRQLQLGPFYLTGADSGVNFPRMRFNNLLSYAYAANLNDGNWHILVGEYDGANISLYLDGAQVAFYNVGSSVPIQISQLFLSDFAQAAFWPGQIGYVALYSVAHSAAQISTNTAAIRSQMAARGVSIPALSQLLVYRRRFAHRSNDRRPRRAEVLLGRAVRDLAIPAGSQ
jgi:Concanavalin A-like lectin/glucanases superfamily